MNWCVTCNHTSSSSPEKKYRLLARAVGSSSLEVVREDYLSDIYVSGGRGLNIGFHAEVGEEIIDQGEVKFAQKTGTNGEDYWVASCHLARGLIRVSGLGKNRERAFEDLVGAAAMAAQEIKAVVQ